MALCGSVGWRRPDELRHGTVDRKNRTKRRRAVTFLCLAVTGAADTVSMVLRNVIRQLGTPDHLRGRMTGINMVFFQGGPQLGELEAGVVAQWMGARGSVVTGGIGCLIATAWIAARTPALRQYRRSFIDASERGRLRSMVR